MTRRVMPWMKVKANHSKQQIDRHSRIWGKSASVSRDGAAPYQRVCRQPSRPLSATTGVKVRR
jgi:hypothetical protein